MSEKSKGWIAIACGIAGLFYAWINFRWSADNSTYITLACIGMLIVYGINNLSKKACPECKSIIAASAKKCASCGSTIE
jgi:hypothetical protein